MITTFRATEVSAAKYKRNFHGTEKIPNVTMVTERLADMLICGNCKENWNEHAAVPTDRVPAGMCLTESNFRATGTVLLA